MANLGGRIVFRDDDISCRFICVLSGSQSVEVSGLLRYSQEYTRECLHFIVKLLKKYMLLWLVLKSSALICEHIV